MEYLTFANLNSPNMFDRTLICLVFGELYRKAVE